MKEWVRGGGVEFARNGWAGKGWAGRRWAGKGWAYLKKVNLSDFFSRKYSDMKCLRKKERKSGLLKPRHL